MLFGTPIFMEEGAGGGSEAAGGAAAPRSECRTASWAAGWGYSHGAVVAIGQTWRSCFGSKFLLLHAMHSASLLSMHVGALMRLLLPASR